MENNIGINFTNPFNIENGYFLFSETPARAIISVKEKNEKKVSELLLKNGLIFNIIGKTKRDIITGSGIELKISEIQKIFKNAIPDLIEKN
jgi:phosphoribosylformylglycinamidine (FGAM) synthase-like enzyme